MTPPRKTSTNDLRRMGATPVSFTNLPTEENDGWKTYFQ
jgi:hypothetical protein